MTAIYDDQPLQHRLSDAPHCCTATVPCTSATACLHLRYVHFADLGLPLAALDSQLWETCQQEELVLITDNRNRQGPDSLEATIQTRNTPTSLPVFTIADPAHLRVSRDYADRIIEKFLDSLLRIDDLRGSGRLYLS